MKRSDFAALRLCAVLMVPGVLATPASQAADLVQVYRLALANDASFASARAALEAGREKSVQGRSGLLPLVQVNGQNTRNTGWQSSSFNASLGLPSGGPDDFLLRSDNQYHVNTYTVSLSQPLYNWGAWQTYQQSKLQQASSEALFAQAEEDLMTRVAQAYFDVLAAQDSLSTTQAQKVATTELLASAKRNYEVGTQTITDANEAQAAYDLVLAQEYSAINDLEGRRAALQEIIGDTPLTPAPLRTGVSFTPPDAGLEAWVASARRQNYTVLSAQLGEQIARRQIEADRAGHQPTASLIASRTHSYQTPASESRNNVVGVAWNMPLFSGYGISSRVREAIALESQASSDLEAARRHAATIARQSYFGMQSGMALVRALQAAEKSSELALRSNKLGYQIGVRVNIDVLNAQKLLYATQKDLSRARYDTIMNSLFLKSAAGTLKEADLDAINQLLVH